MSELITSPFMDIEELKTQIDEYRDKEGTPEFDFKKKGEDLDLEYRDMCAKLSLPFYVTIQHCAREVYRVILSERPLSEELKHRKLDQRTFVWSGTNKKGKTCDTILITHDKYYTNVPMRPEVLGIKRRELRIVEVHYLAISDRFMEGVIQDIRTKCKLNTPAERNLDMNSRLLDARVCEKVLSVNSLLLSENDKVKEDADLKVKSADRRLYNKLETYIEDAETTGHVEKGSRFGMSLIPGSVKDLLYLLIALVGAYFILGLILSFFGMAIPGIGIGTPEPTDPTIPTPHDPDGLSIVWGLARLFLGA